MILQENFKVEIKDIGKHNYIKNKAILEMFENIGTHHSDIAGYGPNSIDEKGVSWVLLDWKLKVMQRPKYGEQVTVNTWGRSKKKAYTYRDFEMYNQKGELCAIGTSKWALIDIKAGRVTRLTDEILEKYKLEEKKVFEEEELDKIKIQEESILELEYKVSRRDIDLNGHMHNLYYLDLAYEALPEDAYEQRPFSNVRIQYKKEIKKDENVKCKYTFNKNEHIITIYNNEETVIHAIIILY